MRVNCNGLIILLVVIALVGGLSNAVVAGDIGAYGIYMVPRGVDAEDYSRSSFGFGMQYVAPMGKVNNFLYGVAGFEVINFLSETVKFTDPVTQLRVEQQTDQTYFRFYAGPRIQGDKISFIKPYVGLHIAFVLYGISTDVVIPDDSDRENEIRQNLSSQSESVFGADLTIGTKIEFGTAFLFDGGVRYLSSFSLPQQLGDGSVTVHPNYLQIYVGIGTSLSAFKPKTGTDE
ncbi:MAG: hypothetical protein P9M15_08165, partial [Candidatus Electryoneaceae bacterium]|nr:hypothetical protein [Candidatus Electryoneaceae bacterium]